MPNQTYAFEWIALANKNLETARLLLRENHFTDSIAISDFDLLNKKPQHLSILRFFLSGKRDSNSRPRPWQGRALPTELFPRGTRRGT